MKYKRYTLKELATIKYGKNQAKVVTTEKEYPIYGTGGLMGYATQFLYDKPSVLIGRKGTIDKIRYVEHPFWTVDTLFYTEINTDIVIPEYFYYALSLIDLAKHNEGTTIPSLRADTLNKIELDIPDIEEQRKIIGILRPISDKIALNGQINNNLEQQALSIFYNLFAGSDDSMETELGYIPRTFSITKIGQLPMIVTDYVANGSFASLKENVNLYQEPNFAYFIRNTDLKADSFGVYVDKHSYEFLSKSTLFGGEIIISNVGDVGSVHLCPVLDRPMTLGNNIIMLRPNEELRYYLYIWFKYAQGQSLIQGIKGGSAQPKFNKTDFKSLPIAIPNDAILCSFSSVVSPMFALINSNKMENNRLIKIRDSILPCLMTGEIDVSEVEF